MRDQILAGVNEAIENASLFSEQHLHYLGSHEAEAIVDAVLRHLAEVPTGTPEPRVTLVEQHVSLGFAPETLISLFAANALAADLADDSLGDPDATPDSPASLPVVTDTTWIAEDDYKAFREFIFATQTLYGVRVRSLRANGGQPLYAVAGTRRGIEAFSTMLTLFRTASANTVATLTAAEQKTFWATLGALVTDTDRARSLTGDYADAYQAATTRLGQVYGPARSLDRTAPEADGAIFAQAQDVLSAADHTLA